MVRLVKPDFEMLRKLIILTFFAVVSALVPFLYERNPELFHSILEPSEPVPELVAKAEIRTSGAAGSPTEVLLGRKVRVAADPFGHFNADFRLNGHSVDAMVDTGATLVAMNRSTARRVGITISPADLKYTVKTANGETRAAGVIIQKLQIGRIVVENVEAVVLDDSALEGTLIGVSFLKRLARYQVENNSLLLVQ
jgi:aspartyl protease family protein